MGESLGRSCGSSMQPLSKWVDGCSVYDLGVSALNSVGEHAPEAKAYQGSEKCGSGHDAR